MNKYWFLFLLVVLVMGCQPQAVEMTGTPTATIPPLAGHPIPVELSALAANPTIYENTYIQLTGQYTKQPRLVCESDPHPSPVTWGLGSDTLLALAGGFDEQLRPLLPQGLTMTAAGRWRHWQGDVGCGEAVQPKDLWYLQVTEIISPSPLTQVTLTPGGVPIAQVGETPAAGESPIAEGTNPPVNEGTAVSLTQQPEPTEPGVQATAVPNATPGTTPTATPSNSRLTPTATGRPTSSTATPGSSAPATTAAGTTTPTTTPAAGATATIGPTPTTGSLTTSTPAPVSVNMGQVDPETLIMDFLNSSDLHRWTFDNETANNTLTFQAVPSALSNIAITIYDPNGVQIANQNNAGTGVMETIANLSLPSEGLYEIILTDSNNVGGGYAIIASDDSSFNISFHQITYGTPQTTNFTQEEEQIWFFEGSEDDLLTITAVPTTGTPNISFELIDPFADTLEYIDEWLESSEPEVLSDYILTESGLHGVWLFGEDGGAISVRLSVSNQG